MIRERLRAYRAAGVGSLRLMPGGDSFEAWYDIDRMAHLIDLVKSVAVEPAAAPA
jgi:hypothetical protein